MGNRRSRMPSDATLLAAKLNKRSPRKTQKEIIETTINDESENRRKNRRNPRFGTGLEIVYARDKRPELRLALGTPVYFNLECLNGTNEWGRGIIVQLWHKNN